MKMVTGSQPPTAQQAIDGTESGAARQKTAAKPLEKGDSVRLSDALETELKSRQAEQAKRIEDLRQLVKSGKYRVGSREVAERILASASGGKPSAENSTLPD